MEEWTFDLVYGIYELDIVNDITVKVRSLYKPRIRTFNISFHDIIAQSKYLIYFHISH